MKLIIFLALTLLSGLFYRFGGIGKPFKRWMRAWIVPLFAYGALLLWWKPAHISQYLLILPAYGLTGGALTTYLDEMFGYDNFYAHGVLIGIACLPLYWADIHWWAILARIVILGLSMGLWCKFFSNDWVEECGRGIFVTLTIPLLLI